MEDLVDLVVDLVEVWRKRNKFDLLTIDNMIVVGFIRYGLSFVLLF